MNHGTSEFNFKVEKIRRKWIHVRVLNWFGRDFNAYLLIDDITEKFEVGKKYRLDCNLVDEGRKLLYAPPLDILISIQTEKIHYYDDYKDEKTKDELLVLEVDSIKHCT